MTDKMTDIMTDLTTPKTTQWLPQKDNKPDTNSVRDKKII